MNFIKFIGCSKVATRNRPVWGFGYQTGNGRLLICLPDRNRVFRRRNLRLPENAGQFKLIHIFGLLSIIVLK